jgi:hypothetical protein
MRRARSDRLVKVEGKEKGAENKLSAPFVFWFALIVLESLNQRGEIGLREIETDL